MEWWDKLVYPMRSVWISLAARLGIRKTGLWKIRNEVKASEYQDIHAMWEMLKRNESELTGSPSRSKKRQYWKLCRWARCAPCICRS
ncbi:hypothetical protein QN277_012601 [Acacia crassicarpa]|uniref:Uncharacterized protein n=1 Tax=Acacia crassicarpa TaxID=499986 RepID=A0AAE1N1G3_9FABA|nr:hypothetical protein QN277_012601 [Acacia crassicarpa]